MSELRVRHPGEPPPDPNERYGEWLARQLGKRKMTQRALALRTGVDHSTVSRLVKRAEPTYHTARLIAKVLGWPHDRSAHI